MSLRRWLAWVDKVTSVEDEIKNIETARKNNAEYKALIMTILVNGKAVGVIDLHNIDHKNKQAEIGYWISEDFQGRGIITKCVKKIVSIAFTELNIHKLIILTEKENKKSLFVAERAGFVQEGILKNHRTYNNEAKDFIIYSQYSNNFIF